jgi:formamidopyrimidine-DNA glycosylase
MSVYAEGQRRRLGDYVYNPAPADAGHGKHDHVVLETDAPARIVFNDHRRFGLMTLIPTDGLNQDTLFKDMGIEPLSPGFNTAYLTKALAGKKTPIKSALLDQRVVAGLGNIYVCEALFLAHVSPKRLAGAIQPKEIAALVRAIKKVLQAAIAAGGSTLRDHAQATGDPGNFQHRFLVYGREGLPCKGAASSSEGGQKKACGGTVKRIVQAGRSSFYCPRCQK